MKRMISVMLAVAALMALTILSGCSVKLVREVQQPSTAALLDQEKYEFSDVLTCDEVAGTMAVQKASALSLDDTSATYRILNINIETNSHSSEYVPKLRICCQTDETGRDWEITDISGVSLVTAYGCPNKTYSGEIFVNLESPTQVYYSLNGFFYDQGTMLLEEKTDIAVDGAAKFICNASDTYGYYDATSEYGTVACK